LIVGKNNKMLKNFGIKEIIYTKRQEKGLQAKSIANFSIGILGCFTNSILRYTDTIVNGQTCWEVQHESYDFFF
jgi:hypothetical protein